MKSVIIIVVVVAIAATLTAATFLTEPEAGREGATKKTAMLVDVVEVERGTHRPMLVATGTVEPAQDVVLRPQVPGRIISRTDGFVPGGFVEEGEVLVRIEHADFAFDVARREAELSDALAALAVEAGRQDVAKAEYDFLGEELSGEAEELILRKPQLRAARRRVEAARADVAQAKLDLRRTTVRAPFDAHILRRDVNVGSQVSSSDPIGRLVGLDEYWVAIEIPLEKLRWIDVPDDADGGSEVRIRNRTAWPESVHRTGHVFRLVGALDGDTRMARLLVSIDDPLATETETDAESKPRMMIGEFVEATVHGREIEDVVRLERDYVRDDDTVWKMVDGKLKVVGVDILVRDATHAYIADGLADGDRVVVTNLSTVVDDAPLRLDGDSGSESATDERSDE